jgi:DNA invertase Pin-like site-specific DNA recombinase
LRIGLYARVSTIDQHPENQINALREFVNNRNDWELVDEYIDKTSGAKTSRTNLDRLMQDARQHKFDTVVFWKVDRLGRSVKHMLQIVEEWENLGINFVISTLGIDTSTPTGKLIFGILAQVAEFERELARERTRLSIARRKKEGKPIGRPKGKKDSKPRPKHGYYKAWEKRSMKK